MFTPFALRGLRLRNRVAVAPILTYAADAGAATNDFHLVHYGARALGGRRPYRHRDDRRLAGRADHLACVGLYDEAHVAAWREIADFVHARSDARPLRPARPRRARGAVAAAGGRGRACRRRLAAVSASALPWGPGAADAGADHPRPYGRGARRFVAAARRAERAGFDMVELQAGHGYLLSSFITPLMNRRTDGIGGPDRGAAALSAGGCARRAPGVAGASSRWPCASPPTTGWASAESPRPTPCWWRGPWSAPGRT
ncbi:MAG: hypothetical protein WDM92_08210 [Caulobacteraceae bacterium]